jgi:hypothetical protein
MPATSAIDVVSDANVALKWFHAEGEEEVQAARALLAAHKARTVALKVLDLTAYEVGNALLRGRTNATADQVATVLEALEEICSFVRPPRPSRASSRGPARRAARAHVVRRRLCRGCREPHPTLATLDRALLKAGLGSRPSELSERLGLHPAGP